MIFIPKFSHSTYIYVSEKVAINDIVDQKNQRRCCNAGSDY